MMTINTNTKIADLVKLHPDALEAIVSISPKFTKLRNPVLRKVIAGRTSIAMASKLGGCSVQDFFNKLQPLGFEIDNSTPAIVETEGDKPVPAFMKNLQDARVIELDVRPVIESGKDPLNIILHKIGLLESGSVMKIINSFEPTPLMLLLGKQGFESYAEKVSEELVVTYFYKHSEKPIIPEKNKTGNNEGWDEVMEHFTGNLETIDVRKMEMPQPMHAILEALNNLPHNKALLVRHKRIPVFLLPELEEQLFSYRIKETAESEVVLLIYKD